MAQSSNQAIKQSSNQAIKQKIIFWWLLVKSGVTKAKADLYSTIGFTLIELSIVLVIIGLVTGGVLVGQDLIRAAETRSVVSDVEKYKTAVYTFKLKHNCLPGDCPNATTYFGAQDPTPATCQTTASTGSLTCDGDGDDTVDLGYEGFRFWQHLAIAGLIKGKYTGVAGSGSSWHHVLGTNAPTSAIKGVGFGIAYWGMTNNADTVNYIIPFNHMFWWGKMTTAGFPYNGFLTPKDAFSIDQKFDDGKPATGTFFVANGVVDGVIYTWGDLGSCTTSTSATNLSGQYNTTSEVPSCSFYIKSGL